jgi:HTH-type transcriptional regulator/antitoxin HigA
MPEAADFQPEWFSPPGHAVAERLNRLRKPVRDFAWEMELDDSGLERLLDGRLQITEVVARRLEQTLGVSAGFWVLREAQYRKDMQRVAQSIPAGEAQEWVKKFPFKEMVKLGWVEDRKDITSRLAECMRYFDVASLEGFQKRIDGLLGGIKLRTSQTLRSNRIALSAWMRRGEIEAEKITCADWSASQLKAAIPGIRKLTLVRDPTKFLPPLRAACASAGVALVVSRAPPGCRASGVTKFLAPNKALLMLSFRYLSDDHFWFSFFHECGHLLQHGQDAVFVEGEEHECDAQEAEANHFAERILIPDPWNRLLDKLPLRQKEIIRFAVRVGVSPGIVVGQLQHRKRISHNFFSYLIRRYKM